MGQGALSVGGQGDLAADPQFVSAHKALTADPAVQFNLTAPDPPPQPPQWLKEFLQWLDEVTKPIGRFNIRSFVTSHHDRQAVKAGRGVDLKGIAFNGDTLGNSLYTVLSVSFPKTEKSEMLLFNLDINNICASGGSACSSGANAGSHVMKALNKEDHYTTVRFSFCKYNTIDEVDKVVEKLKELL